MEGEPPLRVMSLHALVYCERLFYLEEVEEIRVADAAVFQGRRAHLAAEDGVAESFEVEAPRLGLKGRVDAVRRRDGLLVPVEIKKGRAAAGDGEEAVWRTDRIQVGAYALLLEEAMGIAVEWARVRYLQSGVSIPIAVGPELRADVMAVVRRARELRASLARPPVTANEKLCVHCSLAPVCLPEEARLAAAPETHPKRLFPPHLDGQVLHLDAPGARLGRRGESFAIEYSDGTREEFSGHTIRSVVVHGWAQVSTQALALCSREAIPVFWVAGSGQALGCFTSSGHSAQRQIRQFEALRDEAFRLALARKLVVAKLAGQLRYLLRATRGAPRGREVISAVDLLRRALHRASQASDVETLLGDEGSGASGYFGGLRCLCAESVDRRLHFGGRSRRPAKDRFNALLNFAYGMVYNDCVAAIQGCGMHAGLGFFHQPRTAALPLALDLMELFRVPLADMTVVAAVNRGTFDPDADFEERGPAVWLSQAGRRKLIEAIERRRSEQWRHPILGYSISYGRMIELEVRLLEKEWSGEPGLFARARLR